MGQINIKKTEDLQTPKNGSTALGFNNENIPIIKNDQGEQWELVGGGSETLFEVATLQMSYSNIMNMGIPYPISEAIDPVPLAGTFQSVVVRKYYPWLLTNFDEYTNFLFEISETDGHYIKDIQFSDWDDFRTYLNNNLSNNGTYFNKNTIIKCYANIVTNYEKPNFIGINSLFSKLVKFGNYYDDNHHIASDRINKDLSDQIYQHFLGIDTPSNYEKSYWISTKRKNRYNLYQNTIDRGGINSGTDDRRYYFSFNTMSLQPANTKIFYTKSNTDETKNRAYLILNNNVISFYAGNELDDTEYRQKELTNDSKCIIYRLFDKQDDLNQAFMIRPLGVDNLYVNYILNYSGATLYGAFFNDQGTTKTKIRKIDAEEIHSITKKTSWKLILKDYDNLTVVSKSNIVKNNFLNFKLFYIFPDGTMSDLSDTTLYHQTHCNGAKLKRIVRNKT